MRQCNEPSLFEPTVKKYRINLSKSNIIYLGNLEKKILDAFVDEAFLNIPVATRVFLFGSFAYGTPGKESDLDICVVVDDCYVRATQKKCCDIYRTMLSKFGFARRIDIAVRGRELFTSPGMDSLCDVIRTNGILLFESVFESDFKKNPKIFEKVC